MGKSKEMFAMLTQHIEYPIYLVKEQEQKKETEKKEKKYVKKEPF